MLRHGRGRASSLKERLRGPFLSSSTSPVLQRPDSDRRSPRPSYTRRLQRLAMGSPAPWRSAFLSQVGRQDPPTFVLSSLSSSATPRARTVVFRGMWAGLPVNAKNPAELNPAVYRSHLPTLTTDARMGKTAEFMAPAAGQSGGGGPVEAVFWIAAAQTQWRLRGRAYVIGPDIDSDGAAHVRDALAPHMERTGAAGPWSWGRELTAHFGNLSPLMRGSFRNPPPGTPRRQDGGPRLGQRVDDLEDGVARSNFRVVVVVPDEVERLDLSDPEDGRRRRYTAVVDGGTVAWEVAELWP